MSGGLFKYGSSRKQFLVGLNRSPILQSLWSHKSGTSVNSPSTLPLDMKTKDQIYDGVVHSNPGKSAIEIKAKQGFAYAKELMKFYKHGVTAVWQNNKKVKGIMRDTFKITGSLDSAGKETNLRIPNSEALTKHMSQYLYMNLMENRAEKAATTGDLVRVGVSSEASVSSRLFNISRADFQLVRRTPRDFVKIPMFAVIFTIFMEMTPILCYVFPEVTPSTCVLPSLLPRIWRSGPLKSLRSEITREDIGPIEDYVMKTAYNLPAYHVRMLCTSLRLKTKYVPTSMFPEFVLRRRLHNYFNYLTVDNYFLSGMNGDGNIWNLDVQELVLACLERNLVDDCKDLVDQLSTGSLEKRTEALNELRIKLVRFVADFGSSNVGYLAVSHLLEKPDIKAISNWRD
ncbi:hypothetical protein JCM33374_g3413 [Metschnikowia sp. JCM 33374]|nr:hypothetical protein JCM33374_g3413 [Metschnikowia sp. JCM 33374]